MELTLALTVGMAGCVAAGHLKLCLQAALPPTLWLGLTIHFGNAPTGAEVLRPVSRLWPLGVVQVAAGDAHSAALLVDGRLLTWVRLG